MTTYRLPTGSKLKTGARKPYLIASEAYGWTKVETSFATIDQARDYLARKAHIAFAPSTKLFIIEQPTNTIIPA